MLTQQPPRKKDWTNILFLGLSPVVGILGTALYALRYGVAWWEPLLCFLLVMTIGVSIGAGYHRYFSHRAYEAHPVAESILLFFGAMALQNSVLKWARDHRDHHKFVDKDWDPYNINRGGMWAHIFWIFYEEAPGMNFDGVPDLTRNPRVMWQHRWYRAIGVGFGLLFPTLIGAFFGHPLGGLLWGGFLRIVIVHHTTFFVNSVAHLYGSRPYTTENSARDNWLLAFFTHGEGYHNFHHKFPVDFRNGIRWYHWDPNKWAIHAMRVTGLARNLRITPPPLIENAKLEVAAARTFDRLSTLPDEIAVTFRVRLEEAQARAEDALRLWKEEWARYRDLKAAKARGHRPPSEILRDVRRKVSEYEMRFRTTRLEWQLALESLSKIRGGSAA